MSIRYVRVKRRIAVGATPGVKFFARIFMGETYTFYRRAGFAIPHDIIIRICNP